MKRERGKGEGVGEGEWEGGRARKWREGERESRGGRERGKILNIYHKTYSAIRR